MANHGALQKHQAALQRVNDNATAIYDILEEERGPVKVARIRETLQINDQQYRKARQHLTSVVDDVYITQEGLVLRKYVSSADQRFWHLAWCLGLLEVSGEQLVMDEDLLARVPAALITMLNQGKLNDYKRLSGLQTKARQRLGTILKLAEMYRNVDRALGLALLPHVASRDWNTGMREIKNQLKKVG